MSSAMSSRDILKSSSSSAIMNIQNNPSKCDKTCDRKRTTRLSSDANAKRAEFRAVCKKRGKTVSGKIFYQLRCEETTSLYNIN